MSSTMTTILGTSNMRTSSRQTRTNPTRTSKTVGSSLRQNSFISNAPAPVPNAQEHGFYPAITHFTDAITALPREFRRHTSLLKEVDAKAWAPEAHLQTLLAACVTSKPPSTIPSETQSTTDLIATGSDSSMQPGNTDRTTNPVVDNASQASTRSHHDLQSFEHRKLFYNLRGTLTEMMISMDEKNHLINGANEDLSRHLKRLNTIYPHIADEVSEEARLGSLTHWAYIENKIPTRANAATSRREAAAGLAAMHDTDIASRSESRREAMLARKQRQNQLDSDFDDPRTTKRTNMNGKSKRVGEMAVETISGLGISGAAPVVKRRRAEKPAGGGVVMERSLSGVFGGRAGSREPSQQEGTKKRKAPTTATTAARKRINTANSATNSPKLASSPLVGSFGKDVHRNSPIPGNVRPQSYRARQNSTQGRPPSSASNKNNTNGAGISASTPELHKVTAMTGRTTDEIRSTMKESVNHKGDRLIEEGSGRSMNGTNGMKGGILLERSSSRGGASTLKREEAPASEENLSLTAKPTPSPRLPPPAKLNTDLNSARPEKEREQRPSRARSSKTSTPIVNTFAESDSTSRDHHHRTDHKSKRPPSSSSRSARNKDPLHDSLSPSGLPPKRSHKKGAGLAAQAAVLQAKLAKQASHKADTPASTTSNDLEANDSTNGHIANRNATVNNAPAASTSSDLPENPNTNTTTTNNGNPISHPSHHASPHASPRTPPSPPTETLSPNLSSASDPDLDAEPLDSSGEEPRYCYCQQVSYGEMVACDADDCPREWFHLECVGLGRAPGRNARWFCEECKVRSRGIGGTGAGAGGSVGGGVGSGNANATSNSDANGSGRRSRNGSVVGNGVVGGRRGR